MVKICVLSDTHKNTAALESILNVMLESDLVIHLGDGVSDMYAYKKLLGAKLITLSGNCDFFCGEQTECVIEREGVKILCCHGHKYSVKSSLSRLLARAREQSCALALYGHTHTADVRKEEGVTLVNPGCLTRYSSQKSYAYIVINDSKFTVKTVKVF